MIIDHQIIEKSQDDEEEGGKGPSKGTWTVVLGAQLVESKKQELLSIKTISLSQDVECGKLRLSISKLLGPKLTSGCPPFQPPCKTQ